MRFTWFNLMPWPHLPDDFREKHRSVWVDIDSRLFDPARANAMYHEYMDQLEYADSLGFDGIGVNEHHQNGYGLMPSPNIIAASLARRTTRAAICVIGNSIALYNPPIRVAEEFADARLHLGRPAGGRLPGRHADGHQLLLRADPGAHEGQVCRGPRADHQGLDHRRAVRLRRQVQPAALRELLAPADPEAAPPDLHPRRRLHRDLGLLPRSRLQLLVPVLHRVSPRQGAARRLLGAGGGPGQGRLAEPRRLRAGHLRGRHRRRGGAALRRAHLVLLQPVPPRLPRLRRPARLPHDQHHQGRGGEPADPGRIAVVPVAHLGGPGRGRAHHRRQPRDRARPDDRVDQDAPGRPRVLPPAHRQPAGLEDAVLLRAVRREGDAGAEGAVARVRRRRPVVDQAPGEPGRPARPGARSARPRCPRAPGDPGGGPGAHGAGCGVRRARVRRALRPARRLPPLGGRADRRRRVPDRPGRTGPAGRGPRAARLRHLDRRGAARGHARLRAARLGRRRRPRARPRSWSSATRWAG